MATHLLKGGVVVSGSGTKRADILIENNKIAAVGRNLRCAADAVTDVTGCILFPGFIDAHTHFDLDVAGTTTADNFYTGSRADAMAQYGSLKGMALPLLFFPFSVLSALSGLLMPEITRAHTKGDTDATRRLVFTMLKVTGAFSLAAGTGFVLFGAPLAGFIYRDVEVGEYVRILGFVAPFMYLESMVDGVLKGLGEQLATFYYSLADSISRIAAIWLLLPRYGMAAFLGIMITSNLFTFTLNLTRMLHCIQKPPPKKEAA